MNRDLLAETCPDCEGPGEWCATCSGTNRRVRGTHDVASSMDAPDEQEKQIGQLKADKAKLLKAIRIIGSKEHFEECELSALDYGEEVEDGAMCTCCQGCMDDRDTALRVLAEVQP